MSERLNQSHEKGVEVSKEAAERSEALKSKESFIETAEKSEQRESKARQEALELAEIAEAKTMEEKVDIVEHDHPDKQRNDSYNKTMAQVKTELSPTARLFSDFIHNPVVEKTSDIVGKTIARPDSIISGSLLAFIAVVALYAIAQYTGFALSGFETIGAFILGWIVGLIFDGLRRLFKR
ncbi:MAG TPA: hypothetical protein VLA77_00080 [Candidatus Saccharimonadales bacterium]|nr:hypothetical protein [Candidatus Saccharimonadales bacterium]